MSRNVPVEELDLGQALQRAFPGFTPCEDEETPPSKLVPVRDWPAGTRPRVNYNKTAFAKFRDLDDILSRLIEQRDNKKQVSILKAEKLAEQGISCPYFYARLGIAHAASLAKRATKVHKVGGADRARQQEQLMEAAEKTAQAIQLHTSSFGPQLTAYLTAPLNRYGYEVKHSVELDYILELSEIQASAEKLVQQLNAVREKAAHERSLYVRQGAPANVWLVAFTVSMGRVWTSLTGKEPSKSSDPFMEFLDASSNVLEFSQASWVQTIKTAVKGAPDDDIKDIAMPLIPAHELLACELGSENALEPQHLDQIRRALDYEDEEQGEPLLELCDSGVLPAHIAALVRIGPWNLNDIFSVHFGLTPERANKFHKLRGVNLFEDDSGKMSFALSEYVAKYDEKVMSLSRSRFLAG